MVEIGAFTHEHFYKMGLWGVKQENWKDVREDMVLDVLVFVEEIFKDEIEFYRMSGIIWGGGHQMRGAKPRSPFNKALSRRTTYVWSGPIKEQ